jgi:hypothetical protein
MNITKDTLRQLVKEELTELQEQTMSLPPGEEGGRQLEVPEPGQTKAPYGLGADGHLNLKTIAKMQDDMVKLAGKLKGFTNNYFKALGGSEGQGDSNLRKLNVRAGRVAAALEELDEDIEMNLVAQAARYELREESDTLEEMIREEIEAALSERVDPVKLAKDRADKQCAKHGEGSDQCKKFRKRHKDAERSARKK